MFSQRDSSSTKAARAFAWAVVKLDKSGWSMATSRAGRWYDRRGRLPEMRECGEGGKRNRQWAGRNPPLSADFRSGGVGEAAEKLAAASVTPQPIAKWRHPGTSAAARVTSNPPPPSEKGI